MSKNSTLSRFTPACLAGLVLSLAGCATAPGPGAAPVAEDIGSRAQARWDRVLAGDFSGAYEFLSPGFRSSVTPDQYLRSMLGRKVKWTDARYIDSECSENTCNVQILLNFSLLQAVPGVPRYDGEQTIRENWYRSGGRWWYVPDK